MGREGTFWKVMFPVLIAVALTGIYTFVKIHSTVYLNGGILLYGSCTSAKLIFLKK